MTAAPLDEYDDLLPPVRFLTEEEELAMLENLAQIDFGMSLEEFKKALKAGEFDGKRELHGRVIGLEMMLHEYWESEQG